MYARQDGQIKSGSFFFYSDVKLISFHLRR